MGDDPMRFGWVPEDWLPFVVVLGLILLGIAECKGL